MNTPFGGVRNMAGVAGITLVFETGTPQANIDAAVAIAEAHNPANLSSNQQTRQTVTTHKADMQARYLAHALKNKTPAQIYTFMENQIDGWASLADAQEDLRDWLPLMGAAIAWMVMEDE